MIDVLIGLLLGACVVVAIFWSMVRDAEEDAKFWRESSERAWDHILAGVLEEQD